MAKAKLTSLDGISTELQKEYKQREDGAFYLLVEEVDGWALEDVTGLRNTVGATREEREKVQRALKAWDKLGVTPEEAAELIAQARKFAEMDPGDNEAKIKAQVEARVEAATRDLAGKHTKELETANTKTQKLSTQVERLLKEQRATEAVIAVKGNPGLLLPIIERQTVLKENAEGELELFVVDDGTHGQAKGSVRYGKGGKEMDLPQLVEEIKASGKFAGAFESEQLEGTGLQGGPRRPGAPPSGKRRSEMSDPEQAAFIHAHGKTEYLKLPA